MAKKKLIMKRKSKPKLIMKKKPAPLTIPPASGPYRRAKGRNLA